MDSQHLSREISIEMTLGHLLLAWEVMSDKFSDLQSYDSLSEEERRAIWGLADLLEKALIDNGISGESQAEWAALISSAKAFVKTIPVDFLD